MLIVSIISLIDSIFLFSQDFQFASTIAIRILLVTLSLSAVLSHFISQIDTEKVTRIFILGYLIFPPLVILNQIVSDYLFYGILRTDLLGIKNIHIILNLIIGIILFGLTLKFSKKSTVNKLQENRAVVRYLGFFLFVIACLKFLSFDQSTSIAFKIMFKIIIAISLIYLGYKFKKENKKFFKLLLISILLIFIYNSF